MSSHNLPLNYLHLGDSYTCAEGIADEDGWVPKWHERLKGQGSPPGKVRIIAENGWTCMALLDALRSCHLSPEWDRITICIGVNNQYRGLDAASFRLDLEQLLAEAGQLLRNPPKGILLLSIPDWSVSPFARDRDRPAIASELDGFNSVIQTVAIKAGIPFFNWTDLTRTFAGQPDAFAPDGLHPSSSQYAAWADFLAHSKLGY